MGRKSKYSAEEKVIAVKEYLDGKDSMGSIAKRLNIALTSFQQWVKNYEAMGLDAFSTAQNKHYSKIEKEQAVVAYLLCEGSYLDICQKYKIRSTRQLRSWIKKYNGHEELKASGTGGIINMTKGKKLLLKNEWKLHPIAFPIIIITLKQLKNSEFHTNRHVTILLSMKKTVSMHYRTTMASEDQKILLLKLKNFEQN